MRDAALIFLSALVALLITEFYERVVKRPSFFVQTGDKADGPSHRFLHINVTNVERTGLRKFLRSNSAAELLKVRITFIDPVSGADICDFTGRWSSKAEPLDDIDFSTGTGKYSPFLAKDAETEALLPGETSPLTVALKSNKEHAFYGFNNGSYIYGWKDPKLEVELNSVIVKFELFTTKFKKQSKFAISNPSDKIQSFKIQKL
ncbi:MAG TPA: hypothetical protein VLF88_02530 [Candidatus Babeliales bacterium]|nr:hypothetical protein [Candidatus Babeliales bacterium]